MVTFIFVGGRLCVDFVNTELVEGGVPVDLLRGFDDLVEWCVQAQVIGTADAKAILRQWSGSPEAIDAHRRAIGFRGRCARCSRAWPAAAPTSPRASSTRSTRVLRDDTPRA